MPNRLANENSPYLLQHSENPVDWFPWGVDALEKAQSENKPIFLSIGYASCHWCHVVEVESFQDPDIADIMNEYYVNIKVDREERPDLDHIYMSALVAITGQGGWPMSFFLTPECQPFYGGTYYPPLQRYNIPSFKDVLLTVARLWREDRDRLLHSAYQITSYLIKSSSPQTHHPQLNPDFLDKAAFQLFEAYDWKNGGWGRAPKFPQPMVIEFLLQRASCGDSKALEVSVHALEKMANGGMYDVIGGGFSRYSTDDLWAIPHFEKMLYDNAQLARVYLHAYLLTRKPRLRQICEETLEFITREMMFSVNDHTQKKVGFYSSLDADSEGIEGKYYLWTPSEIQNALSCGQRDFENINSQNVDWYDFFLKAYDFVGKGDFEAGNVLSRRLSDDELAEYYNLSRTQVSEWLSQMQAALLKARKKRILPLVDNKALTSWNPLTLISFSEAARYFDCPDYLNIDRQNATFLLEEMHRNDRLFRSWYKHAELLAREMVENYRDSQGIFYDIRNDHDIRVFHPRNMQDNATPAGTSLVTVALLQFFGFSGVSEWRNVAEAEFGCFLDVVGDNFLGFGNWLCALNYFIYPFLEIAIINPPVQSSSRDFINVLWSTYRPFCLTAISNFPPPPYSPDILYNRPVLN